MPEKLDVGYIHDTRTNKLHVYCNLQHTQRNITFCRFQHNTEDTGYNVLDGLSDGQYRYSSLPLEISTYVRIEPNIASEFVH